MVDLSPPEKIPQEFPKQKKNFDEAQEAESVRYGISVFQSGKAKVCYQKDRLHTGMDKVCPQKGQGIGQGIVREDPLVTYKRTR